MTVTCLRDCEAGALVDALLASHAFADALLRPVSQAPAAETRSSCSGSAIQIKRRALCPFQCGVVEDAAAVVLEDRLPCALVRDAEASTSVSRWPVRDRRRPA